MTEIKNPIILNQNLLSRFCRGLDEQYFELPIEEAIALKNTILKKLLQESQSKESVEVALRFCKFFPYNLEFQMEIERLEKLLLGLEVSI